MFPTVKKISIAALVASAGLAAAGSVSADEVTRWNEVIIDTIRETGGPPGPISRGIALMHVSIYDAINSIDGTHTPYLTTAAAPQGASREAAAAAAAHRVLVAVYGERVSEDLRQRFDDELADALNAVTDPQARDNGVAVGISCADALMEFRAKDGGDVVDDYVFTNEPGHYRNPFPFPPDFVPFGPAWGLCTPWTMTSGDQFRPELPYGYQTMAELLASPEYATDLNLVKDLGSLTSKNRTQDQSDIAFFWANDINGTYKPPGHLLYITQVVSEDFGLSLSENARLFALVSMAMGDAGVAAWDAKYLTDVDLWRPIDGIREADTDGNDATEQDAAWEPFNHSRETHTFTPPFPAWISGHSTFGGAHAAIMERFFRSDDVTFTVGSDDMPADYTRTFTSFSQAGFENALSRIYLGVHWEIDCLDGNAVGTALGYHAYATLLRPVCPGDFNNDRELTSDDFYAFLGDYFDGRGDITEDGETDSADYFMYLSHFFGGCS